ncbi:unnamed protein product [Clavelina lepadiformis]|uniref:LisH domain-containing protein n=1 Tax=Clavelina lepadiformis TaxID=159417 RepID=A0ABP0EZ37_CLALP
MLLHSDVARLVLGYLAEESCPLTYQSFVNESSHLRGLCDEMFEQGVTEFSPMTVFGKSLRIILNEYYVMKDAEAQYLRLKHKARGRNQKFLQMWAKLDDALAAIKSYQVASILDRSHISKLQCQICGSVLSKDGSVVKEAAPTDMIFNKQTTVPRLIVAPTSEAGTSANINSPAVNLTTLPIHPQEKSPDLQKTSEHQKKKKKKPKRLNDLERKDRDTEVLGHDASGLLLQNIHNSDTMAVVGATIISQMKKCAQNEQTSSSTPSSSRVNLDIDTNITKSNQESIVQLTLESLLQSDHLSATRQQLEFGKELEELLDFHEPAETEDTDGKNQIKSSTEIEAVESGNGDLVLLVDTASDQVTESSKNFEPDSVVTVEEAVDNEINAVGQRATLENDKPNLSLQLDEEKGDHMLHCDDTFSAVAVPTPQEIATNEQRPDLIETAPSQMPMSPASHKDHEEFNEVVTQSQQTENTTNELSGKHTRIKPSETETLAAVNEILSASGSEPLPDNCGQQPTSHFPESDSQNEHFSTDYDNIQEQEHNAYNAETLAAINGILPPSELQNIANDTGNYLIETSICNNGDKQRKNANESSIRVDVLGLSKAVEQKKIDNPQVTDKTETADNDMAMEENTPIKTRSMMELQGSPAKFTRSQTRMLKDKPLRSKSKTPKIKMKSQKSKKKSSVKTLPKNKMTKTKPCSVVIKENIVSKTATPVKNSPSSSNTSAGTSPADVLSAVSLQPTFPRKVNCSPRKLTVRYGLRLISEDGDCDANGKELQLLEDLKLPLPSSSRLLSHSPETCDLEKPGSCAGLDDLLVGPSVTKVDNDLLELQSENLLELTSVTNSAPPGFDDDELPAILTRSCKSRTIVGPTPPSSANRSCEKGSSVKMVASACLNDMNELLEVVPVCTTPSVDGGKAICNSAIKVQTISSVPGKPQPSWYSVSKSDILVVPENQPVEMDSILEQLVQQAKAAREKHNPLVVKAKTNQQFGQCANNLLPMPSVTSACVTVTTSASFTSCTSSSNSVSTDNCLSTCIQTTSKITASKSGLSNGKSVDPQIFTDLCNKTVTGDSLTSLLNETSLTQMVDAAQLVDDMKQVDPATSPKPQFKTISPSAGLFSVFESNEAIDSGHTVPDTTPVVTQTLREWLNKTDLSTDENFDQRTEAVCRNLNFHTPNVTKKIRKPRYRKLLPKPGTSGTSGSGIHSFCAQPLRFEQQVAGGSILRQVNAQPTQLESFRIPLLSGATVPLSVARPAINVINSPQPSTFVVSCQNTLLTTSLPQRLSVKICPATPLSPVGISSSHPSLPSVYSSTPITSLQNHTSQAPENIVSEISKIISEETLPISSMDNLEAFVQSTNAVASSPFKTSTTAIKVEGLTQKKDDINGKPGRAKQDALHEDSLEEFSLQILTSDEERVSSVVSPQPVSRKRKAANEETSPYTDKVKKLTEGDITAMLNKLHGIEPDTKSKKHGKTNKQKSKKLKRSTKDNEELSDVKFSPATTESVKFKSPNNMTMLSSPSTQDEFVKPRPKQDTTQTLSTEETASSDYTKTKLNHTTTNDTTQVESVNDTPKKKKRKHKKKIKKDKSDKKNGTKSKSSSKKHENQEKRRISLTRIPIPESELGGSPLHLKSPSPVLVYKDSPNTLTLVAESLVELSQSGDAMPATEITHDASLAEYKKSVFEPTDFREKSIKLSPDQHRKSEYHRNSSHNKLENVASPTGTSVNVTDKTELFKEKRHKKSRKSKSKHKPINLEHLDIAKVLDRLKYD